MSEFHHESHKWKDIGEAQCPACPRMMRLVGKESPEPKSKNVLLTFQCYDCGQVYATRSDQ